MRPVAALLRCYQPVTSFSAAPISARLRTVFTPASSSAANFSSAVHLPPEMMAPAWHMRLTGGAVSHAMYESTVLELFDFMFTSSSIYFFLRHTHLYTS